MRVLEVMGARRQKSLKAGKLDDPERTGVFTTGIVASTTDGPIALFASGRKHAGENLSKLLDLRSPERSPPLHMCDGLDRNRAPRHKTIDCNCLVHGRRQIVDVAPSFPAECRDLLERLRLVFKNEAECKRNGLTGEERLAFHKRESGPVMKALEQWMKDLLAEKRVEPNSGLGSAFAYLLKRWTNLTRFLEVPDAPLENNLCERVLKMAIRHRRNSLFYLTLHGAGVGDIYMDLIHTAELHGVNPFDYLVALLTNARQVAESPSEWLPWRFRDSLAKVATPTANAA